MKYYQYSTGNRRGVAIQTPAGKVYDVSRAKPYLQTTLDGIFKPAHALDITIDELAEAVIKASLNTEVSPETLSPETGTDASGMTLLPPVDSPEVWAFGVTYQDSMRERQAESNSPDVYARVYSAERPESFFKATFARLGTTNSAVGIRADSPWNVPEPELTFILFAGRIVAYTIGNDMSSRSIEGDNPLYLPQAKVYDKSAAIGPCLVSAETLGDPQNVAISMSIRRDYRESFSGSANTSSMKRTCAELADWLQRHNNLPCGSAVMTGTGIIPPPDFTLQPNDEIVIEVSGIGKLVNTVVSV